MRFLIAGLGSIGQRHLANLIALGERDIILYRTYMGMLHNTDLERFPVEHTMEAALSHHPDAMIVSNPTRMHMDVAIQAARAGCHILLEKPIADSMEQVPEFIEAVRAGGGQVLVGYHFRFHPGLQQLRHLLEDEVIGQPVSAHAHWGEYLPGWHPWEDYRLSYSARADLGGGVILTLSHPLDYLRWILGEVAAIWSFTSHVTDLDIPVEAVAEIGLRFASGLLGSLHLDYCQQPASHHLEIVGTQGTIRWDNADGTVRVFRSSQTSWDDYLPPAGFDRNQLFLSQMRHFLEVMHSDVEPVCSLDDGVQALRLCLAAMKSQNEGRLIGNIEFG